MAYSPELDDDIEDDDDLQDTPSPASTVAGPQTTRAQVMQRISGVRNPAPAAAPSASNASSFDLGPKPEGADPAQMQAAEQFSRSSALTSGLGRALNTLAAGTGAKTDNGGYDAIDKQGQSAVAQAQASAKNKQQLVKDWITGKAKQAENTETRDFKERELQEQIKARLQAAGIAAGDKRSKTHDAYLTHVEDKEAGWRSDPATMRSDTNLAAVKTANDILQKYRGREDEMPISDIHALAAEKIRVMTGGVGTEADVAAQMPHNISTKLAGAKSFFTGNPEPAKSGQWVKSLDDYFKDVENSSMSALQNRQSTVASDPRLTTEERDRVAKIGVPTRVYSQDATPPTPPKDGSIIPSAMAGGGRGPKPGTIEDGYMYVAGDPNDPNSWVKAK